MIKQILRNLRIVSLTGNTNIELNTFKYRRIHWIIPNFLFSYFNTHICSIYFFFCSPFYITKILKFRFCKQCIRHNYIFTISHKDSINLLISVFTTFLLTHN